MNFDVSSNYGSVMSYGSFTSHGARVFQPITNIVALKDIQRRMSSKIKDYDELEVFGFDRRRWIDKFRKAHFLNAIAGDKKSLGSFIKHVFNREKRMFVVDVRRKASPLEIDVLISHIETHCPPFRYVNIFTRSGKKWDTILNISDYASLRAYIITTLYNRPSVNLKLTW